MATPVVESLRRHFPDGHIAFLTERASRDVLVDNPFLDELIVLDQGAWKRLGPFGSLHAQWAFYRNLRSRKFDAVIDLFGNPRSAILSVVSGAEMRIGFDFRGRRYCYTKLIRPRGGEVHEVLFNLDALAAMDVPIKTTNPLLPVSEVLRQASSRWLAQNDIEDGDKIVGINPGGGWEIKRWKPERFAAVADRLKRDFGAHILLFWGPGERETVEALAASMTEDPLILPETTLSQMAAYLEHCTIVLSNDSGPMHMAAALGVPTVGIFGPTNPDLQGPYGSENAVVQKVGLPCLCCNRLTCKIGNPCMETLTPEEVLSVVESLLITT
ncbi:MAG: glycosyltransferase family 9 protein, partial [Candidatus Latescibacteria bacterium]|nr:glycosyltransferase family 9 protein [Candidatus Latescibacterota bacterium]